MEQQKELVEIAEVLGREGVEQLFTSAEQICAHHRRDIELTNEPRIAEARAELALWADEDTRLGERLRLAQPPGDRRCRRFKALIAVVVALVLMIGGLFLSLLALAPFRIGAYAYLFCVGIALVCPYCVERCVEEWNCRKLIRALATVACIAAIGSLVLLAEIRGKLFAQEFADAQSQAIIDSASSDTPQNGFQFYAESDPLLQLMMAFLAVAMELGAGLAFHDAKRYGIDSGEDAEQIAQERRAVRQRMAMLFGQATEYENEGARLEARFWRNFHTAMLTHASRKAVGKMLALGLCLFIGAGALSAGEQRLDLVILIDLSASVATKGPDGKTDFQKNVEAVTDLLRQVPAGAQLTVVGITGNSFQEPDILLFAEVPDDPGYFGERLTGSRRQLVTAWQERATRLVPNAKQTDILGAILVASQVFTTSYDAPTKVLVIYSDMRQATSQVDLERTKMIAAAHAVRQCKSDRLVPSLGAVRVYVRGVDAVGEDAAKWESLQQFWLTYFTTAGAKLDSYSVLRNPPHTH